MNRGFDLPAPVLTALGTLGAAGHEAWIVGGCVRDLLLGGRPADYDITTDATPDRIAEIFRGRPVIPTGVRHGTVTLLCDGMPLEITTYRADGAYSDSRRPDSVTFTRSLEEDLARRDFTVNALAYRPDAGLRDPFGGREDLARRRLRAVGDPSRRFAEDALRILRALRFSSVLGFAVDPATERALRREKSRLCAVSRERIYAELKKLLCGQDAGRVLLRGYDVLGVVLPELLPMAGFDQHSRYHCYDVLEHTAHVTDGVPPLPRLRLAALLHDVAKPSCFSLDERGGHFYGHEAAGAKTAASLLARLRADNATKERVTALVLHHGLMLQEDEVFLRRCLNRFGTELFRELLLLSRADNAALSPLCADRPAALARISEMTERLIGERACFSLADLAVGGDGLLSLGIPEGPAVGAALRALLDAVISGAVENERTALCDYAKRLLP